MTKAFAWFLAVRYLLSRWVNVLGTVGIAVAVWALIVVIAVFSGFIAEIRDHIRGATADLVLTDLAEGASFSAIRPVLEGDDEVAATAPRLLHYALLYPRGQARRAVMYASATGTGPMQFDFVTVIGVDPEREAKTSRFESWLHRVADVDPRLAVPSFEHPFEVPERLYRLARLRAGLPPLPPGSVLSTPPGLLPSLHQITHGVGALPATLVDVLSARFVRSGDEEKVKKIKVTHVVDGAYETRYRAFDDACVFMHIDEVRGMLGEPKALPTSIDLVSEVAIRVHDEADLSGVQERLSQRLHEAGVTGTLLTWEQQNAQFLSAVNHERAMMKIVLFAVMLVAAFLVYATLHMMVTQKTKDIGILTSLGATPSGIAAIFVQCGLAIAVVGCTVGTIAGMLSAYYLNDFNGWLRAHTGLEIFPTDIYDLDRIPYRIEGHWVAQVLAATLLLSLLVAWLPARRAARRDPVKALSYE